jgi:hypothetical protein
VIGVLNGQSRAEVEDYLAAFQQALSAAGYVEGQNKSAAMRMSAFGTKQTFALSSRLSDFGTKRTSRGAGLDGGAHGEAQGIVGS